MSARGAYTVEVRDWRGHVDTTPIFDPFIHTWIRPKSGLRARLDAVWAALTGRLEYRVIVNGDRVRVEKVMELDADYLGPAGSPSRKAWDAQLNHALVNMTDPDDGA